MSAAIVAIAALVATTAAADPVGYGRAFAGTDPQRIHGLSSRAVQLAQAQSNSSGDLLSGGALLGGPASPAAGGSPPPGDAGQNILGGDLLTGAPSTGSPTVFAPPAPAAQDGAPILGGDLLQNAPSGSTIFTGQPPAASNSGDAPPGTGDAAHTKLVVEQAFPSAVSCGECHPKQFSEWSVSQHAYAQVSPIFNAMQRTINANFNGSNGDFCFRCHTQIGTALGESSYSPLKDRHPTSREGITCISCHRVDKAYNKVSGRVALNLGPMTDPVLGPQGDAELKRVLSEPETYRVVADPDKPGRKIHGDVVKFTPIESSTFCGSCHDVTLNNGFRLEEAFSEYRMSPAAARGVTCQNCHMGTVQGAESAFEFGPAAVVDGVPTKDRKVSNHLFSGPDYSVVHPGLFPFSKPAQQLATIDEWTEFNYKAGWGTDAFENSLPDGYQFPPRWRSLDDRYDARKIVEDNLKLLEFSAEKRLEVLRNGYQFGEIVPVSAGRDGIRFNVAVKNGTDGHPVPTGFTGERLVWIDVTVTDPTGNVIFRSGDRDPNGDLRDTHSAHTRARNVPLDDQLFNLQAVFLVRNLRGSEQPAIIPIPYPSAALRYIRPADFSGILAGQPRAARSQKRSIQPANQRWAKYSVDSDKITAAGAYKVALKLRTQMVPVNLVTESQRVGFDFNMSTREVVDNLIAGSQVLAERDFEVVVQ